MRQNTLMLATMVVLTACGSMGPTGDTPWDENRDGLITACEGLNSRACDATAGCEPSSVICTRECRDDGHGGCLPCAGETCRPMSPLPPPLACSQLSAAQCLSDPRCELSSQPAHAPADAGTGDGAARPRLAIPVCAPRTTPSCEALTSEACLTRPGCALSLVTPASSCSTRCDSTSESCAPCPPSPEPQVRCVTLPMPDLCEARDSGTCTLDGRCVLEPSPVCEVAPCAPGVDCPPCATPSLHCVAPPPPDLCGPRDVTACEVDGRCVLEESLTCQVVCSPGSYCPPCVTPSLLCVPAPVPDQCSSRDLASCGVDGLCAVEPGICPAVCIDNGDGGCLPCAGAPVCVSVSPPSRCEGLDRASCHAAGCSVEELLCEVACNADGGCAPCDAFICVDGQPSADGGFTPTVDGGCAPRVDGGFAP